MLLSTEPVLTEVNQTRNKNKQHSHGTVRPLPGIRSNVTPLIKRQYYFITRITLSERFAPFYFCNMFLIYISAVFDLTCYSITAASQWFIKTTKSTFLISSFNILNYTLHYANLLPDECDSPICNITLDNWNPLSSFLHNAEAVRKCLSYSKLIRKKRNCQK